MRFIRSIVDLNFGSSRNTVTTVANETWQRLDMSKPEASPKTVTWIQTLLGGWLVLTLLFWALNPGATEGYGAGLRFVLWAVHVALPLALCQMAQSVLAGWRPQTDWASVLVSGGLGGLAFVPISTGLDFVFPDLDGAEDEAGVAVLVSEAMSTTLPVALCWVALNAPRLLSVRSSLPRPKEPPTFLAKLPPDLGSDVVSLSAELHYLRVRTPQGNALILYPFGTAIQEIDAGLGQQVHRSHWAAFRHVEDMTRRGDGAELTMTTGDRIPVSRRYRKTVSEALKRA